MNSKLTKYQLKKHREDLDEKHLEKQLVFLNLHKSEILNDIHKYRLKHFCCYRNQFVSIDILSKLLNTSKRTIRLLATQKIHFKPLFQLLFAFQPK